MAETKKGFDLAGLMKGVSNLNTREQIEYIPFDLLDPDPDNFYSIDGLNGLADSIATVGLVHPLRVRQSGERYTVTSGHRRRAAIKLLIDSGEDWSQGVPCIIDHGEALPEFNELKLIFANNQRAKTSAELSREAERVEALLAALKEKGYAFPGRMQDHVAQAMGVKAAKLKRLHAIRSNLVPELLTLFDSGDLNEACSYEAQKLPEDVQRYLAKQKNISTKIGSYGVRCAAEQLDALMHPTCKCPDGERCTHTYPRIKQTATSIWPCPGVCCLKCWRSETDCPYRCKQSKDALAAQKAESKASAERAAAEAEKLREENRAVLAGKYAALDILARDKKLPDDLAISIPGCQTVADLHDRADGKGISDYLARKDVIFDGYYYVKSAVAAADQFDVSVDFLLGRTPEPAVNRGEITDCHGPHGPRNDKMELAPEWQTGTPPRDGRYFCKVRGKTDVEDEPSKEFRFDWDGETWYFTGRPIFKSMIVVGWWPLPEV